MAACDTAAVPSGSGGVVPEAGVEPAHELLLRQRPLPLGYSGSSGAPGEIRTPTTVGLSDVSLPIGLPERSAARMDRTSDLDLTVVALCRLSYDSAMEPQPGIETGSAAYKAAASPQCFRGKKLRNQTSN